MWFLCLKIKKQLFFWSLLSRNMLHYGIHKSQNDVFNLLGFKSNFGSEKWRENLDNLICQNNRHTRRLSQTTQMCESVHMERPQCLVLLQILLNEKCQDTMHQARGSLCQKDAQRMTVNWISGLAGGLATLVGRRERLEEEGRGVGECSSVILVGLM